MEDLHKTWSHRWLNPKLKVQKSPIHELGTFATGPISKGEVVAVYGGIIVPKSDIKEYREKIGGMRGIQVDEEFFICPTEPKGGCFNHSCDANYGCGTSISLIAIRDIKPGEEVVFDWAFTESNFEPFECTCGSPNCRKIIKPTDWQNPELQKKVGEYFSPYLKRKFLELNK